MTRQERYNYILDYFRETMPQVTTELEFGSVFQLLVATVLSAQCTDKRVNMVTPELFRHYPDARTMAEAEPEDVLEYVSSVSYPNAKALQVIHRLRHLAPEIGDEHPRQLHQMMQYMASKYRTMARMCSSLALAILRAP